MNSVLPIVVLFLGLRMADLQSQANVALTLLERLLSGIQTWAGNQRGLEVPLVFAIGAGAAVLLLLGGAILFLIRARSETRKVQAELAATVACRTATESAGEATTEFLASMSHWIRTPVNAMVSFIDLALQVGLDPDLSEHEVTVRASAQRLLHIADDVLEFSRIEAGRLQLDNVPFSISECIASAMKLVEGEAAAKKLLTTSNIDPQLPDTVSGDPERLRHVIFNLLDYAVRFTTSGSVILSAALESSFGDDVVVRVAVTGTGLGIPAAERSLISGPAQHARPGAALKASEIGVGLLISGRLIDLMRGTMKPQSQSGGSTLEFTAQFQKQMTATVAERPALLPATASVAVKQLSILVAENNSADRRLITRALESAGHRVWVAANGKQAVQNVQTEGFDLILLDLQMPRFDGLEVAREIRAAEPPGLRVPIYAFTARVSPDECDRCIAAGIDDLVAKPLTADEVLQLISKLAASPAKADRASIAKQSISVESREHTEARATGNNASVPDVENISSEPTERFCIPPENSYMYVEDPSAYKDFEQKLNATSEIVGPAYESNTDSSASASDRRESNGDTGDSNVDWGNADFALASMLSDIEDVAPNKAGNSYVSEPDSTATDHVREQESRNVEMSLYLLANATGEKTNGFSGATMSLFKEETGEAAEIAGIEETRYIPVEPVEQPVIAASGVNLSQERNQDTELVGILADPEPLRRNTDGSVAVHTSKPLDRSMEDSRVAANGSLGAPAGLALLAATTQLTQPSPPPVEENEAKQAGAAWPTPTPAGNRPAPRPALPGLDPIPTGSWDPFEQARKSLSNAHFGVRVIHNDGDPSDRNLI